MSKNFSFDGWAILELLYRNKKQFALIATGLLAYYSPLHPLINVVGAPAIYIALQTLDYFMSKQN